MQSHPLVPLLCLFDALLFLCVLHTFALLQGDDGGQIYVVARATQVKCSVEMLEQLLIDLDAIAWAGNDANSRRIYYERRPIGSTVAGGMGGGFVSQTPWVHEKFVKLAPAVLAVLRGERTRIQ